MPLLITRMILSLKKAANSPDSVWSSGGAAQPRSTVVFSHHTIGGSERGGDNIALGHLPPEGGTGLPQSRDQS